MGSLPGLTRQVGHSFYEGQYFYQQNISMSDHSRNLRVPLGKLNSIFPQITLPNNEDCSISDYIEKVIRELPKPTHFEVTSTIFTMKTAVDKQELDIQMQMIEESENTPPPLTPLHSHKAKKEQPQPQHYPTQPHPTFQIYQDSHSQYPLPQIYDSPHQSFIQTNPLKEWKWQDQEEQVYDFIN